ncbi:noelin-2-like isoform X2 [Ciona intestinalis]
MAKVQNILIVKKRSKKSTNKNASFFFTLCFVVAVSALLVLKSDRKLKAPRANFYRFITRRLSLARIKNHVIFESFQDVVTDVTTQTYNPIITSTEIPKTVPPHVSVLSHIGVPVVYRTFMEAVGAWMKDSMSRNREIFVFEKHFGNNRVHVYTDATERDPSHDIILPYDWGGTGHVVMNGSIYYNKFNTSTIVRCSITDQEIKAERDLSGAGFANQSPYSWGGSSDIDFAADDTGLWVIYATQENEWNIVISQLDVLSLKILSTWKTRCKKKDSGNAFIAQGVLYVLKRHEVSKNSISFAFDTTTQTTFYPKIEIKTKYMFVTMLDYNPTDNKLYAWDRGNLVTYDVLFNL